MSMSLEQASAPSIDDVLLRRFQLAAFHPWQREAVEALLTPPGRVLVVAPTGGGKSLTYQLPATVLPGTTLVLSPLVALMEDQVRALTGRGIEATFLAATLDPEVRRQREANMIRGAYKIVYAAPERLASESFISLLAKCDISLVAIDEAHCIAHWGHDFRPDYLRIGTLLKRIRPPRILACTATATPLVRKEIREQLGIEGSCHEVLRGFARPNLHLAAISVEGPKAARVALAEKLKEALGDPRSPKGGAIVYAATRKATEQWATFLDDRHWKVAAYHAGLPSEERTRTLKHFSSRKLDIVVATNAFGMGIDRSDIRAVVHVQPPSSIEAYYQEVGRAGRDGAEAHGLLMCSGADIALRRRMTEMSSDGVPAPVEQAARAWSLFRELLTYLDARTCRHDFVLRYFGDEHELLGGCGHCDVCASLDERDDQADEGELAAALLVVQKALSGVARAQKRAGLGAIADMLRGVDSEKTRKFGFTNLTTFALLSDRSPEWILALLRALLAAGWIDLTPTEHPVPFVTKPGWDVMKGIAPMRLSLPRVEKARGSSSRAPRSERSATVALDDALRPAFERLRTHRAEVARLRGVPPYVVAFDRTLIELVTLRPRTASELLGIYGFGPARVEQYGAGFLEALARGF